MGIAHGIGEPRRLERDMETVGAERVQRREIEALEDVEQHQCRQTLGIGRQFQHVEPAIVRGDGCNHLAAMAGEILLGQVRAPRRHGRRHVLGNRPLVEGARSVRRDRRQRLRQRR